MPVPIELSELLEAAFRSGQARLHTSIPGIIRAYDASAQRADVEIAVADFSFATDTRDDPRVYDAPLVIPSVRVQFPSGGGFGLCLPLSAGDECTLLFSERSTAEFEESGQTSQPLDARRHSYGHPVAIPGSLSAPKTLASLAHASEMRIGTDAGDGRIDFSASLVKIGAGATDFVALSTACDANFTLLFAALNALVTAYNSHGHEALGPPPAGVVSTLGVPASPPPLPVGATVAKAK